MFRVGDIIQTPFEPSGPVRVLEIEPEHHIYGITVRVEFVEDHPNGYRRGTQGRYCLSDWNTAAAEG